MTYDPGTRPGRKPPEGGPGRRGGGGVPDGLLVGGVLLLVSLATLTWSSTGLAGLISHGRWPERVAFTGTGPAVRSFLTMPRDVAGAWPDAPPEQLPSPSMLWLVFLAQLMVIFSTALWIAFRVARWRARRTARGIAARVAPLPPRRAASDADEYGEAVEYEQDERFQAYDDRSGPGAHQAPEAPEAPGVPEVHEVVEPARAGPTGFVPVRPVRPGRARRPESGTGTRAGTGRERAPDPVAAVLNGPEGLLVIDPAGRLWSRTARQRGKLGPVHVYDPGHATDAPVRLRWAPQRGCEDMTVARRRAAALLAPVRPTEPVFQLDAEAAGTLLRCYLHAAALAREPVQHVLRWAHGHANGKGPAEAGKILRGHARAAPGASMDLESTLTTHPARRDAGLELIAKALGGLDQLHIRQSCASGRVDTLALDNVAGEGGTLYVVGDHQETAGLRHALTDAVTADQPGLTVVGGPPVGGPTGPSRA